MRGRGASFAGLAAEPLNHLSSDRGAYDRANRRPDEHSNVRPDGSANCCSDLDRRPVHRGEGAEEPKNTYGAEGAEESTQILLYREVGTEGTEEPKDT